MQLSITQMIMLVIAVIASMIILYFVMQSLPTSPVIEVPRDFSP